jgi:hypothetical protein
MATNKKGPSLAGYFLSRTPRRSASGIFTDIRGPNGYDARLLDRGVYEKASAKAGKSLRSIEKGGRPKGVA